jgi:hypothetical protein
MGVIQSAKELYYHLEDRYYELIDRISTKVPIHKLTDAIDKVVPSFALLLLIIAVIIAYFVAIFVPVLVFPREATVNVFVQYEDRYGTRHALEGATVEITHNEQTITLDTNADGMLSEPYKAKFDDTLTIAIYKEGFKPKPFEKTIEVKKESINVKAILTELILTGDVSFRLVDSENNPIANKRVSLSFECSNPEVEPPASMEAYTDYSGKIQLYDVELDCLPLLVSVETQGFEPITRLTVRDGSILTMQAKQALMPSEQKGRIIVNLTFENQPVEEPIAVELYKDTGAAPVFMEQKISESGQVVFEVLPGTYKVRSKATVRFNSKESGFITVGANEYRTISLEVEERIVGYIKLRIVDEANKEPLQEVRVTLMKGATQVAFDETDSNGNVQFNLTKDESYDIVIDHPEYCIARLRDVRKSGSTIEIELKKYVGDCGGVLLAKVVDPQNNPIPNAKVAIFDENGNGLGWSERITDINGEAEFKGLYAGKYKFFAYKGFGSGWSDVIEYMPREAVTEKAVIVLEMPKATLELKVVDNDKEPLPFSDVTLKDAITDRAIKGPNKIEDLNGTITFEVDAGLPIYLYITKEGYASYTTERFALTPNEHKRMQVILEPQRISGEIQVQFLGLFKKDKFVSVVAPGEEYVAKFKISVPEQADYDKFGIHIRTGHYNIMEKDFIYLKDVWAPGKPNIVRGTSFNPDEGTSHDMQFLSTESAKWVNIEWSNYGSGTISVHAKIKVKESASAEELPIFWRAWALKQGTLIRDPIDYTLGDALSERELYAKAYSRIYQVGMEKLCTDKWCTVLRILDITNDVAEYIEEGYVTKVLKPYKLYFSILNNSSSETDTFSNVQLKIFNDEKNIEFKEYKIFTDITGTANANETEYIEVGDLRPSQEVYGEITFVPKTATTGSITIRLHEPARHAHIFEKTIFIETIAANEFIVEFKVGETFQEQAPVLASGIENTLVVRVRDKQSGLEVSDAVVKIKNKFGDTLVHTSTTSLGLAEITVPALMPAETVFLSVEKPDYAEATKEIKTDATVLTMEPEKIGLQLNVHTKPMDTVTVRLLNKTQMPLKLNSVELVGDFFGLIDDQKVYDWLASEYFGKMIAPQDKLDIALKVPLSDFGKMLSERKNLEGKLIASVSAYGHAWLSESEVSITIGLGGEVDNPECLIVSINDWKASTKSNEVSTDFSIRNACTLNGKPIKLKNLSAKIEWESNQIGDYYIKIADNSIELRGSYFKILRGTLNEDEELPVMLTFAPDAGITGTAKATVVISAEHSTETEKEVLTASIETEIDVISLDNCIRFDKDIIKIKNNEEESEEETFTIETKGCQVPVDFLLDTELNLSEKEFTLEADDSKTIIILPSEEIPGQYPIYVKTKTLGESEYSFRKLIRVIVEPDGCLRLNRYEFDIYDDLNDPYDGFDVGLLINDCYKRKEEITISYDERDWLEAIKTGALWGLAGFIYGGVRATMHGKDFFGNPLPSTVCSNAGLEYCGTKMICKDEKIKVVKNVTCCASECITEGTNLKADTCKKRGYKYCGPGLCAGRERIVNGLTCCSGKCKSSVTESADSICKKVNRQYDHCEANEICPGNVVSVDGTSCCTKKCTVSEAELGSILTMPSAKVAAPTGLITIEGIGDIVGSGFDLIGELLNIDDPWTGAVVGFVAGTLFTYWQQSQNVGEFEVPVAVKDLVVEAFKLVIPKGLEEEEETQILVEKGETKAETTQDKPLGFEKIEVIFKNNGVEQEEPYKPIYRILKVEGTRLDYNTHYEIKKKKDAEKMREMEPVIIGGEDFLQKFHLQFNAYKPKPRKIVVRPEAGCKIAGLVGTTGPNAVPRIKLKWNWKDIDIDECDEGGKETYCDATQFSIELLKKIKKIDELLRGQKLECPSAEGILSEKTQELDSLKLDVAVTKIRIEKSGKNATVVGTIKSNNNQEMTVNAVITVQKDGSPTSITCPEGEKAFQLISESEVSCTFTDLEEGLYTATITAYPQLNTCEAGCKNENLGNDSLFTKFLVGSTAGIFEKCEPYSTSRLEEFIAANPNNANLKKASELVSFKAYLIQDGYTLDFRKDFHEFSETKDFFSTPSWYKGTTGLGRYFVNEELFEFKSPFLRAEFGYLPAGKYQVQINITYNNDCWCLFDGTEPNAKIEVRLERLETPEPDSVFYYLPFDGLVGVDSENGRQGYGVNFRQKSEEIILINEDIHQPIRTSTIANSVPIPGGWIEARMVQDFKTLNNDARGVLLDIEKGSDGASLIYSPSIATPIILKVSGGERNKAYAFYQLTIDYQPQEASSYLTTWTGIGKGCKDFSDAEVTEAFDGRRDVRGGVGRTKCAGSFDTHQYGIEWCDVKRKGDVFLKRVLFTPQNTTSMLEIVEAADDAVFITPKGIGKQVELFGVEGLTITSVEKILRLVEEKKVCIAGLGNSAKATFFWNPQELTKSTLSRTLDSVLGQCIKSE